MKISYHACLKCRCIKEHFFETLLETYNQRVHMRLCEPFPKYDETFFNKYICTGKINLKLLSWKNI